MKPTGHVAKARRNAPNFTFLAGGDVANDECSAMTKTAIGNLLPA
jgi:hypothetical protein